MNKSIPLIIIGVIVLCGLEAGAVSYDRETQNQSSPLTMDNQPPSTPSIQGETNGKAGRTYVYTFVATDPEADEVFYCINWSDGTGEACVGPYDSGEQLTIPHMWSEAGTYIIRAKAEDTYGAESAWGELSVTMPCSLSLPFSHVWNVLFARFPNAFPLLRHIVGY